VLIAARKSLRLGTAALHQWRTGNGRASFKIGNIKLIAPICALMRQSSHYGQGVLMRLTKYSKHAFIRAVMQDVPMIDYHEQITKLAVDDTVERLPPAVKMLWNNAELRPYINLGKMRFDHLVSCYVPSMDEYLEPSTLTMVPTLVTINKLLAANKQQDLARSQLKRKLESATQACTTTQALLKLFPEFAKYLPAEDSPTKNLPALANLMAEFVAAGWPKK
jgi:hypothetical protein